MRIAVTAAIVLIIAAPAFAAEEPVPAYVQSDANAGVSPIVGDAVYKAFHERAGIDRIVADSVDRYVKDSRISAIFKATDLERLKRTLSEQICYVAGGPCRYTGRDMAATHKDMGLQVTDFAVLVEDLQLSMDKEGVPFHAQNKLLAKLAPMKRVVVER